MPIIRTPNERFANLPGFPYQPRYKEQPEIPLHEAGHFLQEEKGEEIAQHILDFMARTPITGNEH